MSGARVLVVDDEPQILRALQTSLRGAGYEVVVAATAEEALSAAAMRPPAAVILDLVLPDGSGTDVCRELRSWSSAPVLVLSVVGDEAEKVAAFDAGADDYVQKPFGIDELLARLRALLRRAGPSTEPVIEVGELVVIGATDHHAVELEPAPAHAVDGLDALEDLGVAVPPRQHPEAVGPEGVEADGDAADTGLPKRLRLGGQEDAVGGDGEIADARLGGDHGHEARKILAQQRLAAREANLVHPEVGEHVHEPGDLLEGQDVAPRQPRVLLLRHAVGAPEVAAVRHRETQVAERTQPRVVDHGRSTQTWSPSRLTGKHAILTAGLFMLAPLVTSQRQACQGQTTTVPSGARRKSTRP